MIEMFTGRGLKIVTRGERMYTGRSLICLPKGEIDCCCKNMEDVYSMGEMNGCR
jgi:hypothetical protein